MNQTLNTFLRQLHVVTPAPRAFWIVVLLLLDCTSGIAQNVNEGCSIWRRDIKTLKDLSPSSVNALLKVKPEPRTVCAMNREKLSVNGEVTQITNGSQWENLERQPSEHKPVSVHAKIIACGREANDQDYHIVLQDLQTNDVMVAEIPSPDCTDVTNPVLRKRYAALRTWFDAHIKEPSGKVSPLPEPIIVTVVGVPFWDGRHPGKVHGAAINFVEIHPVLDFIAGGHHAIK